MHLRVAAKLDSMPVNDSALDVQLYTLIGKIVVTFNSVEALLRECVAESLGSNTDLSVVVLSRASFRDLLEMFQIASHVTLDSRPDSEELQQRAKKVANDLSTVNARRNLVVHSHYGEQIEISVDDNDDAYELKILTRTKFKRDVDQVYFPSMATEQLYDLNDLRSDRKD